MTWTNSEPVHWHTYVALGVWVTCNSMWPLLMQCLVAWAPSQYAKKRLIVRSREVSKPRDWYFKLSYRFEIWQAHRQHCCRSACQISERSDNSKYKSRGFETSRDLTIRRLFGYWDGALVNAKPSPLPMMLYCQLRPWEQNSVNYQPKYKAVL